MRARILAAIILLLLLVLPFSLYWYFTTKKISSLRLEVIGWWEFSFLLNGSLGFDALPLADKVLSYEKNCTDSCVVLPIIPANYTLLIKQSGKIDIRDNINISVGSNLERKYISRNDVVINSVSSINTDLSAANNTVELLKNNFSQGFSLIDIDIQNRVWIMRKNNDSTDIGLVMSGSFVPMKNIPVVTSKIRLDTTKSVFIIEALIGQTELVPVDLSFEKAIRIPEGVDITSVVTNNIWRIWTNSGILELRWDRLIPDLRFTDVIDVSSRTRIGYIDASDTTRLSLGNHDLWKSILVELDRTTGEWFILRENIGVRALFFYQNKPAYIDNNWEIFLIETRN
jgi:hypothetical protein